MTFFEEEIAVKAAELIEWLGEENRKLQEGTIKLQEQVRILDDDRNALRRNVWGLQEVNKELQGENSRLQHQVRIGDADRAVLCKNTWSLKEENTKLQTTIDDIQVVAIVPLLSEMNHLRQELDVTNDALQLHQTSGDYETGQLFAWESNGTEVKRLREENKQFQEVLDDRQELIALLNEQNNEKNEGIDKLQQLVRDREADCHTCCLAGRRLQEKYETLLKKTKFHANLGLATTRDLLAELSARFEIQCEGGLDYKTVDEEKGKVIYETD